eukprot:SAG31_NODE_33506_length_343_cov_0.635246_1_plen_65_part_01
MMVGRVYFSGGSYMCYPEGQDLSPGANCKKCDATDSCPGGGDFENAGCSTCEVDCGEASSHHPAL